MVMNNIIIKKIDRTHISFTKNLVMYKRLAVRISLAGSGRHFGRYLLNDGIKINKIINPLIKQLTTGQSNAVSIRSVLIILVNHID
jgi:hypothetical protein